MLPVRLAARSQVRRRRGATVGLVLLVTLAGGVVLATVAGASRTNTSMQRFVAYSRPEDLYVTINGPQTRPTPAVIAAVLKARAELIHLPQVAAWGRDPYIFMTPDRTGAGRTTLNARAAADSNVYRTVDRPLLLKGRLARLDRPYEAVVDDLTAARNHLHVGSRVTTYSFTAQQNDAVASSGSGKFPAPAGPRYTFRVVGIAKDPTTVDAPPSKVAKTALFEGEGGMHLTPAFVRRFARDHAMVPEALPGMEGFRIRLRHGMADLPAFEKAVSRIVTPGDGEVHPGSDIQTAADKARRPIHVEAIGLLVFGALTAVAGLVVVGQALSRQVTADAEDNTLLAALGLSRGQLFLVPLVRAATVAVVGAIGAVLLAVALSHFTPIGLARRAEIAPGVSVNVAVLGVGFLAVVAAVVLLALAPAWRSARRAADPDRAPARPGPFIAAVAGSPLGPPAVVGFGMSFERGRGAGFRTALIGTLVAVAGVVAAVTFGVSLRHLVDTPREQGWNWDVAVGNPNSQPIAESPQGQKLHDDMVRRLERNPYVGAFSGFLPVEGTAVDGHVVQLAAIETDKGSVHQPIVDGRPPRSASEVVLGRDALSQIHKHVGDTVTVSVRGRHVPMRIVGMSLQPTAGDLSSRLSDGGAFTTAALRRLGVRIPTYQFAVRYRPGVDKQAALSSLVHDFGKVVLLPYPGGEVGDLARIDLLPYVLAGLMVVLAIGALELTLVASVRRHRRDLAVLKSIGFTRRQVSATVAWQATLLATGALLVGIPAGVLVGRWTWHLVAHGVGSVSPPIVPLAGVVAAAAATLLIANVLAGAPGRTASRLPPAEVLRTE